MRTLRIEFVAGCLLSIGCIASYGQTPSQLPPQSERDELKLGTELTRSGKLQEAIPHLLAARQGGAGPYAASLNLAICYLGIGSYREAALLLEATRTTLPDGDPHNAGVDNLLAQAYLGDDRRTEAWQTFQRAAAETPKDEKLYDFIADASTDHHAYEFGLRVVDAGLRQLPDSARLHYERAVFLGRLDRLDEAKPEFDRAAVLAPGSYIACLAQVQEDLYLQKYPEALKLLRDGIKAGRGDYQILSLLGTVLLHQGAAPGDPEFVEAQDALEHSAQQHPEYSSTQLALGQIYLMEGRPRDAVEHLEMARPLDPDNPAVYINLAQAYRQLGERDKMQECQSQLSRLIEGGKAAEGRKAGVTAPPR